MSINKSEAIEIFFAKQLNFDPITSFLLYLQQELYAIFIIFCEFYHSYMKHFFAMVSFKKCRKDFINVKLCLCNAMLYVNQISQYITTYLQLFTID